MRNSFCLLIGVLLSLAIQAQDIPQPMSPPRLVNDFVGALNGTERETLEQKLRAYNDSTSTQITVAIVKTTQPYPAGDYAFELGRRWGVGQKGKNNGIVLLWATDDRKIYIATGYGMEGAIPDVIAKRIISNVIVPEFKQQMYYRGLDRGTDEIIKYATGEYQAESNEDDGSGSLIGLFIFIIILIIILSQIKKNGGGGGMSNRRTGGTWYPYTTYSGWGSSSGSWGSGGGGSSFGGFGGGSFGGGGAGGDY
ncbi:MAG: TPM domain-containing protein [Runella sp.]